MFISSVALSLLVVCSGHSQSNLMELEEEIAMLQKEEKNIELEKAELDNIVADLDKYGSIVNNNKHKKLDSLQKRISVIEKSHIDCRRSNFFLKPSETDKETFLSQFKPCGWYSQNCGNMLEDEFWGDDGNYQGVLKAGITYNGYNTDEPKGIYLTEFDIGMSRATFADYLSRNEPDLLNEDEVGVKGKNLTYLDAIPPFFSNKTTEEALGETCLETFVKKNDRWQEPFEGSGFKGGCMGTCGSGCEGVGFGRDCLKHDVCAYFKALVFEQDPVGFCSDFDCGDEAAQTVTNCRVGGLLNWRYVDCIQSDFEDDDHLRAVINPAAKIAGSKRSCVMHSGWEKGQGMPILERPNGKRCFDHVDCESGRCENRGLLPRQCFARLENGELCNENTDCMSGSCFSPKRNHRRRCGENR